MAQQITIDIVAETKKLVSGVNEANGQIDGMSNKLKGAAAAAGAAASAFVLKQGVTFLKQGIDEAKEAAETMRAATTTFGEGSAALQKITEDADKFGKAIAVDNDVIIQLATQLGSRLPADSKILSAELVNLAFDIDAYTAGAVTADAVTGKLAKAFADGELTAKELTKIFPDLEESTYAQAEALSKAGDNQGALNLLIEAGAKKYGNAAEDNVTSSQKFDTALAGLKENIATKFLPTLEKLIDFITKAIEKFDSLPGPVQNLILAFTGVVAIGGPLLGFLASAKTSLAVLGITQAGTTASTVAGTAATGAATAATGGLTVAQRLLNITMLAAPWAIILIAIAAVIAIGVLLYKNWDTVKEYAQKLWDKITDVFGWVKENWPLLLAILTGPIGLAVLAITKNFDKIKDKAGEIVENVKDFFAELPKKMLQIGKDLVYGLWNGMKSVMNWLKEKIENSFVGTILNKVNDLFGRKSPSKVFAEIGRDLVRGLAIGIDTSKNLALDAVGQLALSTVGGVQTPQLATGTKNVAPINVTVNAGLGTDPYELGRVVDSALKKYGSVSGRF